MAFLVSPVIQNILQYRLRLTNLQEHFVSLIFKYIRCEMTPTSVGGERQISISGGSQFHVIQLMRYPHLYR